MWWEINNVKYFTVDWLPYLIPEQSARYLFSFWIEDGSQETKPTVDRVSLYLNWYQTWETREDHHAIGNENHDSRGGSWKYPTTTPATINEYCIRSRAAKKAPPLLPCSSDPSSDHRPHRRRDLYISGPSCHGCPLMSWFSHCVGTCDQCFHSKNKTKQKRTTTNKKQKQFFLLSSHSFHTLKKLFDSHDKRQARQVRAVFSYCFLESQK